MSNLGGLADGNPRKAFPGRKKTQPRLFPHQGPACQHACVALEAMVLQRIRILLGLCCWVDKDWVGEGDF